MFAISTLAFGAGTILFPSSEVRLASLIAVVAFVVLGFVQDRVQPFLAMLAWAFGFELVFEAARLTVGNGDVLGPPHIAWEFAAGLVFVPLAWRAGVRPSWPLLLAALGVFVVWMASGFHVNEHTMVGFQPFPEVLNETSKMLWAAAYFVPLLRPGDQLDTEQVSVDGRARPVDPGRVLVEKPTVET